MVDKVELVEQLRKLKQQIHSDPQVKAIYDLDGDGNISGEEWDKARKAVIAFMEARALKNRGSDTSVPEDHAAEQVFQRIKGEIVRPDTAPPGTLLSEPHIIIKQHVENIELVSSLEGRNRYAFTTPTGKHLAHAEETDTGFIGSVVRNLWSARRSFVMGITIQQTPEIVWLKRRFEWIFSNIDVFDDDSPVGTVRQRFAIINRKYELESYFGDRVLTILGPVYRPWTFDVYAHTKKVASIQKKWSGFFKEAFTSADTFTIVFEDSRLLPDERKLIIAAAIAIDIDFFENKGKR